MHASFRRMIVLFAVLLLSQTPALAISKLDPMPKPSPKPMPQQQQEQTQNVITSASDSSPKSETASIKGNKRQDKKKAKPKSQAVYSILEHWRLTGQSPSVTLNRSGAREVSLKFERQGVRLVIPDADGRIPRGTTLTVPEGYSVYVTEGHTRKLSGIAHRVDYDDATRIKYEEGSELQYTENSGLVIVRNEDIEEPAQTTNLAYAQQEAMPNPLNQKVGADYNNRSVKPEEVIVTYGLSSQEEEELIRRHNDALRLKGNREKAEVYSNMVKEYACDYLAAYYAALANFDMGRGGQSRGWCEKSLTINPRYLPAKQLLKRANGI